MQHDVFFVLEQPNWGLQWKRTRVCRRLISAILWLIGGGVLPQRVRNRPSLAGLSRKELAVVPLRACVSTVLSDRPPPLWKPTLPS